MVFEELSRGWMGLAGILGTHLVLCDVLATFGTEEQKERFLPRARPGRAAAAAFACLNRTPAPTCKRSRTIATRRRRRVPAERLEDVDHQRPARAALPGAGQNRSGGEARLIEGMSAFVIEKGCAGARRSGRDIDKLGYKGSKPAELHFDNVPVPADEPRSAASKAKGFKPRHDRPRERTHQRGGPRRSALRARRSTRRSAMRSSV